MALFKSLRGKRSNLPSTKTDGYAYFCTDDGTFHIDYKDDSGVIQRKQINAANSDTVNNHTVESDVPTDAVFTDTTYALATTSDAGVVKTSVAFDDSINQYQNIAIDATGSLHTESNIIQITEMQNICTHRGTNVIALVLGQGTTSIEMTYPAFVYFGNQNRGTFDATAIDSAGAVWTGTVGGSTAVLSFTKVLDPANQSDIDTALDDKMDKSNPVGSGSLSMNRKSGSSEGISSATLGYNNSASGTYAYAEGYNTSASGYAAHVEGIGTRGNKKGQHVQGTYNILDTDSAEAGKYAHIVGNGTALTACSNAHTVDWSGNGWFAGTVKVGGTGQDDSAAKELATQEYVDNKIVDVNEDGNMTVADVFSLQSGFYIFKNNFSYTDARESTYYIYGLTRIVNWMNNQVDIYNYDNGWFYVLRYINSAYTWDVCNSLDNQDVDIEFLQDDVYELQDQVGSNTLTTTAQDITGAINELDARNEFTDEEKEKLSSIGAWDQIYDSGAITSEVNSISGIDIADYKSLMVAIKCVNTTSSTGTRSGAVIFTGSNGQDYAFNNIFSNLIKNGTTTSGAFAKFNIVDGFIICENALRAITADGMLSDTEGEGIDTLAPVSGGLIKCTNSLSTMAVSNAGQSADYYYGVGSRVIVWGCKS